VNSSTVSIYPSSGRGSKSCAFQVSKYRRGAVHRGHHLAERRTVTLRALSHEALIALPRGTGGRTALEEGFAALGRSPRVAFEGR
jgi:hypothetical protein